MKKIFISFSLKCHERSNKSLCKSILSESHYLAMHQVLPCWKEKRWDTFASCTLEANLVWRLQQEFTEMLQVWVHTIVLSCCGTMRINVCVTTMHKNACYACCCSAYQSFLVLSQYTLPLHCSSLMLWVVVHCATKNNVSTFFSALGSTFKWASCPNAMHVKRRVLMPHNSVNPA